jgi:hypothetical protein
MTSSLLIGNARIDIRIEKSILRMPTKDILGWVKCAAEAVTVYYGRFPLPQLLIQITPFEGRGIHDGRTFGERGGRIIIRVVNETSPSEPLDVVEGRDWLAFAGIEAPSFPVISGEKQFAEKLHAYSLPRGKRANTRTKDLIDMALLIRQEKLDKSRVKLALGATFARRATHDVPEKLKPPQRNGHRFLQHWLGNAASM